MAKDPIIELLAGAHTAIISAGRAYTAGDRERALDELDDVVVDVLDARADLRRAVDAEKAAKA
jgi:hypothetical protein